MGRTWIWAILGLLATSSAWAVEVHDVRLWRAPDHTRIVFDLTGPAEHKLMVLQGPDRIVIDGVPALSGTSHRIMPDRIETATFAAAAAAYLAAAASPLKLLAALFMQVASTGFMSSRTLNTRKELKIVCLHTTKVRTSTRTSK